MGLSLAARLLRAHLRSGLRGSDRLANYLGRFKRFHSMPVSLPDTPPVYIDLRLPTSRSYLQADSWERGTREVMRRFVKAGMVAFDIGANMGFHTALLSQIVGPRGLVYAFEPNPILRDNLKRTCHELGNAQVLAFGLSDKRGSFDFFIPIDHTMASLRNWTGLKTDSISIETFTLDSLTLPRPDFIKCDVEGFEYQVFQGAKNIISTARPIILFESYANNSLDHLAAPRFLESLGYTLYVISENGQVDRLESFEFDAADLLALP